MATIKPFLWASIQGLRQAFADRLIAHNLPDQVRARKFGISSEDASKLWESKLDAVMVNSGSQLQGPKT